MLYPFYHFFFFLMIRRPPRSTLSSSSAASDVYKRQVESSEAKVGKPDAEGGPGKEGGAPQDGVDEPNVMPAHREQGPMAVLQNVSVTANTSAADGMFLPEVAAVI
eukprot:TRINITY_DN40272_c0_g1_i1.p1 TRINITY_DN40272_c0_g1~~TRINITY_DN40272_c0_g1_i1.p1  ORF type:complete len:106 (-),score=34.34 TRINITY_DN40272_c0_g1_i1:283-600(-)